LRLNNNIILILCQVLVCCDNATKSRWTLNSATCLSSLSKHKLCGCIVYEKVEDFLEYFYWTDGKKDSFQVINIIDTIIV